MTCSKTILGVDPGLSGCLSFYDGTELLLYDMPTFEITKNDKVKRRVDIQALLGILRLQKADHCYLEQINAMPGQGVVSMFSMGRTLGHIEACVAACGIPVTDVTPMKWKKAMGCTADKDSTRMRASQLAPQFSHNWTRKKDDGRAESFLISLYGYNQQSRPLSAEG